MGWLPEVDHVGWQPEECIGVIKSYIQAPAAVTVNLIVVQTHSQSQRAASKCPEAGSAHPQPRSKRSGKLGPEYGTTWLKRR